MEKTAVWIVGIVLVLVLVGAFAFIGDDAIPQNGTNNTNNNTNTNTGVPGNTANSTVKEVSFQNLINGTTNAITQRQTRVVNTSAGWGSLWTEMFPTQMIASAIDFNNSIVVAVFSGEKNTGGYTTQITRVVERANNVEVFVVENSPGAGCMTTQALTQPYHVIQMPKTNKTVQFTYEQRALNCS